MRRAQPCFVYFLKPVGMDGPIKIGCSEYPQRRLLNLMAWSPFPLELLAQIDGDESVERRFHAAFQHLWERGGGHHPTD